MNDEERRTFDKKSVIEINKSDRPSLAENQKNCGRDLDSLNTSTLSVETSGKLPAIRNFELLRTYASKSIVCRPGYVLAHDNTCRPTDEDENEED